MGKKSKRFIVSMPLTLFGMLETERKSIPRSKYIRLQLFKVK
jgi:hypothetical protein